MFCTNCGKQISDNTVPCPYCGFLKSQQSNTANYTDNANINNEYVAGNGFNQGNPGYVNRNNYINTQNYGGGFRGEIHYCVKCGRPVPAGYKMCRDCSENSRQQSSGGLKAPMALLIVTLCVCVVAIGVLIYFIVANVTGEGRKIGQDINVNVETPVREVKQKKGSTYSVYYTYYPVTWEEAKAIAESEGGYLACVDSAEEFETICSIAESNNMVAVWLGAKRESGADWNTARYVNGEPLTYVKWLPGEPTYYYDGIEETCLMALRRDGEWYFNDNGNDLSMDYPGESYRGRISFVIEKDVY